MPKLGDLVARIRLRDNTRDGVDAAEGRVGAMFARLAAAAAVVGVAFARGMIDAFEDVEQRLNTLEQRLGRTSEIEKALAEDLTRLGFDDQAVAAAVGTSRRFGGGLDFAEDIAALETAGINTRFVAPLAEAFGLSNQPSVLSDQLNAAFDVATRSGRDPEEILSEIADNPQVYKAFGSIPQAVDFIGRQSLIPSETTIQLEQGILIPEQQAVEGDVEALSTISPSFGERTEGRLRTRSGLSATRSALRAVPVVGDPITDVGVAAGAYIGEQLGLGTAEGGQTGNRTRPAEIETFDVPIADLLLEIVTRDAAARERVDRIANRIDLDRRRGGSSSALDIPG